MFKFQNYMKNLDSTDKLGIKEVDINKAVVYSGDVKIIKNNNKVKEEDNPKQPLAAAIVGLNNTAAPLPKNPKFFNAWTDMDALELFLASKPTCYLILGKPGAGAYSLGEGMSKKLNCIHLNPKNIVTDEIEQKSSTGLCIDFNMKNNKAITFEVFLKMLKIKLESSAIQHRGYIISGFPLVTSSRNPKYLINSLNGEDAVEIVNDLLFETIANLKKKKPKARRSKSHSLESSLTSDINEPEGVEEAAEEEAEPDEAIPEEEEELRVELPKFLLNTSTDIIHPIKAYYNSKKTVLLQQLNDLFSLKLKPDIVIYLSCPDKDLVTKKSHKYINYKNNKLTVEPFTAKVPLGIKWPARYTTSDYLVPFDSHTFNSKYSCVQPINFKHKSIEQMCNYKYDIFPFLEKKLKTFDPKNVIKIDARVTLHEMMQNVLKTLFMMSIMPVLIPVPLLVEEPPDDMEEFWSNIDEQSIIDSNGITFKRSASPWYNRCPVELKKRLSMKGKPKLAVAFSKYVYIMASLDNMISFCRNPRPYLKLKYLEPTCRIIVTGTKKSGKTMISECLSWLFDTPILNYDNFLQKETQKKYDTYARTILSEIIATIEDARYEIWVSNDLERLKKLNEWGLLKISVLRTYIPLLEEYKRVMTLNEKIVGQVVENILQQIVGPTLKQIVEQTLEQIIEQIVEETVEEEIPDLEFLNDFNTIRSLLSSLPFLDDLGACENALAVDVITPYAPTDLVTPKEKPKLPTVSDEDVKKATEAYIIANELQKEMQPTIEELVNELIKIITSIDAECQKDTELDVMYGKYIIDGFPTDPEYWGYLAESKLLPDYTITLIENREINPELIENYKYVDGQIKNHLERYVLADDPLIKIKLKTKITSTPETRFIDMKMILHDIIQTSSAVEETEVNLETDPWVTFPENVEKFKEDWDSIKLKLDEYDKCFIDVELGEKTDIQVVEEVLLRLRKCYFISCEVSEEDEPDDENNEDETPKDIISYNSPQNFGEIGVYCPISYYNHGILWEGKPEFSVKFNKKLYRLCKEECSELFQKDVLKYESYNKPFKALPPLRVCVIGCIGSGKTTISKLLAKELGLMHIDFSEVINDFILPKHFKKVGRQYENAFTDAPIDDEAVTEFQMDEDNENLISDILSHETELRKMVFNYFERGAPILPQLMQRVITKLWFQDPFLNTGFILDGYPRLPTDIEDMTSSYCIPDLIIDIDVNSETTFKRLSSCMFKTWKEQLTKAKEKAREKLVNERKEWMNFLTKNIVAKLIYDEILENMFFIKGSVKLSNESVILDANPSGSIVDTNLFSTYNEMIKEFPEPEDQSTWEKADEVREKIDGRIEGIYESDYENIQALKDILIEQRIKTVTINGNKRLINVTRSALSKLTNLRNRCESFFEETFVISHDIADTLLLEGFCLLSKFNKICPVYIFENANAIINNYSINKLKNKVFPVIHRSYLYFICGEDSVKKFRTNPLKYITCSNIFDYNEYPLRIGVIGAPKSGKSSLAAKLAARYGLICLSRGIAVRNILETKHWTELGTKMLSALTTGECINSGHVMKAVQSMAMDNRTRTNGFVFDGFPETGSEATELASDGIYPNIVFDISASIEKVVDNSQKEVYYDILKRNPPYSRSFIANRYRKWQDKSYNVREWINSDYQNVYVLDGNKSRWQCLHDAVKVIDDFIPKAHFYLTNVQNAIVPAHVMCISTNTFEKSMSNFKNLCPLCLRKNVLRHNLCPVDKKGVVQYKNKFYWICPQHINIVLKDPHLYLKTKNIDIPEIPAIVKTINPSLVYENGVCIVTYAEHLPAQIPKPGINQYAASFHGNTYLFCSQICQEKFMAKPHLYYDITVFKEAKSLFQPISLKGLPSIGYLEQTVGNLITDACCSVNVLRPKYPGLSVELSGLLHIALYLKTHDPLIDNVRLPMYMKASKNFDAECKLIKDVALFLRSMDNPFAHYPICCNMSKYDSGTVKNPSSYTTSSTKSHSITSDVTFGV